MKFRVTMKTELALDRAADQAARASIHGQTFEDDDEREDTIVRIADDLRNVANRWFGWRDAVTLEIDTDLNTCKVLEVR